MVFELSESKRDVLARMAEGDWSPTELAEELDRTRESVYNHLADLDDAGVVSKRRAPAKTRPRTVYSVEEGFVRSVVVVPGVFDDTFASVDADKAGTLRAWALPDERFHRPVEELWWELRQYEAVEGVAITGPVAAGEAAPGDGIDLYLLAVNDSAADVLVDDFDGYAVGPDDEPVRATARSLSSYLGDGEDDGLVVDTDTVHPIYDPRGMFASPA